MLILHEFYIVLHVINTNIVNRIDFENRINTQSERLLFSIQS